jgi:ferredoxin
MSAYRVVADLDLCQAHQMCQGEAAKVFGFEPDDDKVILLQERPGDGERAVVEQAVRHCPAMALSIVEED